MYDLQDPAQKVLPLYRCCFASKALTLTPGAIYTVAPTHPQSPLALPAAPPPDRPASPLLPHALNIKTRLFSDPGIPGTLRARCRVCVSAN